MCKKYKIRQIIGRSQFILCLFFVVDNLSFPRNISTIIILFIIIKRAEIKESVGSSLQNVPFYETKALKTFTSSMLYLSNARNTHRLGGEQTFPRLLCVNNRGAGR